VKRLFSVAKKTNWYYWLVALGLHGALLGLPLYPPPSPPKETPIQVTRLPKSATAKIVIPRKPVAKIPAKPKIQPSPRSISRPQPIGVPAPTPSPSPVAAKPTPSPSPSVTDPLALFAKAEGAAPGCSEAKKAECWQLEDTQWRSVAGNLEKRLQNQGYSVTKLDDLEDETGMGIYKVDKDGVTKYLHLLLTSRGTVYLLESKPLSRSELEVAVGV
jgi:hypothetical protein